MRTEKEYQKVINFKDVGLNNCEISKILNIPRTTINDWIKNKPNFNKFQKTNFNPKKYIEDNNLNETYSYILGLYLGDGYINKMKRTYKLRIVNDVKYSKLNMFIKLQLEKLFPSNVVGFVNRNTYLEIYVHSNKLEKLFPQHEVGRKHQRKIILTNWQTEIISNKYLLIGLFHSDGCYYINKVNGYEYESYSFSNKSLDIHKIFQTCCNNLGLSYTKTNKMNETQLRKRDVVNYLKDNIGTKYQIKNYLYLKL